MAGMLRSSTLDQFFSASFVSIEITPATAFSMSASGMPASPKMRVRYSL